MKQIFMGKRQQGAVGKFNTKGIINIIENINSIIGNTVNNTSIMNLLKNVTVRTIF